MGRPQGERDHDYQEASRGIAADDAGGGRRPARGLGELPRGRAVLGRDLDGLEGIIQDMAAGVDDAESIDVAYVRMPSNAQLDDEDR